MAEFKDRVKVLRLEHGMTQSELAKALRLNNTTISAYERGAIKPSFEVLDNMADKLNVDINYLLGNSNDRKAYPRVNVEFHRFSEEPRAAKEYAKALAEEVVMRASPGTLAKDERELVRAYRKLDTDHKRLVRLAAGLK